MFKLCLKRIFPEKCISFLISNKCKYFLSIKCGPEGTPFSVPDSVLKAVAGLLFLAFYYLKLWAS